MNCIQCGCRLSDGSSQPTLCGYCASRPDIIAQLEQWQMDRSEQRALNVCTIHPGASPRCYVVLNAIDRESGEFIGWDGAAPTLKEAIAMALRKAYVR